MVIFGSVLLDNSGQSFDYVIGPMGGPNISREQPTKVLTQIKQTGPAPGAGFSNAVVSLAPLDTRDRAAPCWSLRWGAFPLNRRIGMAGIGAHRKDVTLPNDFRSRPENGHSRCSHLTARFAPVAAICRLSTRASSLSNRLSSEAGVLPLKPGFDDHDRLHPTHGPLPRTSFLILMARHAVRWLDGQDANDRPISP